MSKSTNVTTFKILSRFFKMEQGDTAKEISATLNYDVETINKWNQKGYNKNAFLKPSDILDKMFAEQPESELMSQEESKLSIPLMFKFVKYVQQYEVNIPNELLETQNLPKEEYIAKFRTFFKDFLQSNEVPDIQANEKKSILIDPSLSLLLDHYKYTKSSYFVERCNDIDFLKRLTNESQLIVIAGLQGMGKTELARYFMVTSLDDNTFKHVIFTTYDNSIKKTIANLKTNTTIDLNINDAFTEKIKLLKNLCKDGKTLLVIDNYDNTDFQSELTSDSFEYQELLSTGCNIIFTTTIDLSYCYGIESNQIFSISALPMQDLCNIFCKVAGRSYINELNKLINLIENTLRRNTYLVVLTAELVKIEQCSIEQIVSAYESHHVDDSRLIPATKNGKFQGDFTILQHFCKVLSQNKLIHPDNENERELIHSFLYLLAFLPNGGIKATAFLEFLNEHNRNREIEILISKLKRHHLVFENDGSIYLQPIMREYFLRFLKPNAIFLSTYISSVNRKLSTATYTEDLMQMLRIGKEVDDILSDTPLNRFHYDNMSRIDSISFAAVVLCSLLSSGYDIIKLDIPAYDYGIRACQKLDIIAPNVVDPELKFQISNCYNLVGYAILHKKIQENDNKENVWNDEKEKVWNQAYSAISKAYYLAKDVQRNSKGNESVAKLLTKIHGNLGACYLEKNNYSEALKYHSLAEDERLKLLAAYPCAEYEFLLATTYRCIATDWYHLNKIANNDNVEYLTRSFHYHTKSLEIFIKLYGKRHLETAIGANRFVGTGISLINALNDKRSFEDIVGQTLEDVVSIFYDYINSAILYYAESPIAINSEINDLFKRIEALMNIQRIHNILPDIYSTVNHEYIEKLSQAHNLDNKTKERIIRIITSDTNKYNLNGEINDEKSSKN